MSDRIIGRALGGAILGAALVGGACSVEREPAPRGDVPPASPDAPVVPDVRARQAAGADATADALRELARPEARNADAPPIGDPPPPQPRREPGITLLAAGADPKAPAQRDASVGARQRVAMTLAMDVAMQIGRQAIAPQTVPALDVTLDLEVLRPPSPGSILYAIAVADVRVQEQADASARVREAVQKTAASLAAAKGEVQLGPQGIERATSIVGDDGELAPTLAGFRESYAHLFVALPDVPIGNGARWEVVSHGDRSGLPIQRIATYTLSSRAADHLTLAVAVDEHALAGEPAAGPVQARGYTAHGTGEVVVDLGSVAPISGSITSSSTTHAAVALGGEPQAVIMQVSVRVEIGARDPS